MTDTSEAHAARAVPPGVPALKLQSLGRELELKFVVEEQDFRAAQRWDRLPADGRRQTARRLQSEYFDTENCDLANGKAVLRVRTESKRHVMTLKWSGGFAGGHFERGEVEVELPSSAPDITLFDENVAREIAKLIEERPLQAIYSTDVKRLSRKIVTSTGEIEIAFDSGLAIAGDKRQDIREVEMELKSGEPAALYSLGIAFAESFPVRIGCQTKSERAAALRSGEPPPVVRATTPLSGTPTVDDAIGLLISTCIQQFLGNWPAFEFGDAAKAIHQMRVSMRRLRSVIGLIQKSFPNAEFKSYREHAKQIASAMGEARNWDVFNDLVRDGPMLACPEETGFASLLDDAERHRTAGYETIRNLLAAGETTKFVFSIQAFVTRQGWRNGLSGDAFTSLTSSAKDFAASNLGRLHRKLVKRGKDLLKLAPDERHEVRKDLKKLRYTADLFGSLFENDKQVRHYTRVLSKLQDQLGLFNDLASAHQLISRLNPDNSPPSDRAAGIIIGWCKHVALADDGNLEEAWEAFCKTKLFV